MNPETIKASIQAVVDGLTPLAQKMRIPLEGLFGWAIKHNYALAVADLIPILVAVPVTVMVVRGWKWAMDEKDEGAIIPVVFGSIFAAVLWVAGLIFLGYAVVRIISPEWSAAQDIASLVRGE